ncbi:MAG: hypothetical protein HZB19_12600 [Chloroflexi bacterium]|nr:hypothetical protein [Chloroflexota bacterium]
MPKKRRAKKRNSDYKPVFTDAEHKLMQEYGIGDLMDEVGVNRVMLMRTLDKMNEVKEQLTFRDHLEALRAVSYTTGRIASLLDTRERLYQPYQEVEKQYKEYFDQVEELFEEMGPKIYGQKKWDEMQWDSLRKAMDIAESDKRIKFGRR